MNTSSSRSESTRVTSGVVPDREPAEIVIGEGLSKSPASAVSRVAVSGIVTAELSVALNLAVTKVLDPSATELGETPRLTDGFCGCGVRSAIVTVTLESIPATTPDGSTDGNATRSVSSSRSASSVVASEPVADVRPAFTVMLPTAV